MNQKAKKLIACTISLFLLLPAFSGCGNKRADESLNGAESDTYPINTETTLSAWCRLPSNLITQYEAYADTPLFQEIEKRTGIHIDFRHPVLGQENEQFNLMVASGELPDIISYNFATSYPGGPDAAIEDNIIYPLDDLIADYAPNFKSNILDGKADFIGNVNDMKSDSGKLYAIQFARDSEDTLVYNGIIMRKDWLDAQKLEVPTTIAEWENVLSCFQKAYPSASPLSFCYFSSFLNTCSPFISAYGVKSTFYRDGKTVKYGPLEDGFRDFLALMNRWYDAGYIDKEFTSNDKSVLTSKLMSDQVGSYVGLLGSYMGNCLDLAKGSNTTFDLVGAPNPTLEKGERPKFGHRALPIGSDACWVVTPNSPNKELALRWLDYGYTEEGKMLYNFGIEGESYTMVDGFPTYTDLIMNNPDGLSVAQALSGYVLSYGDGPFVQDHRYYNQYMHNPQQLEAVKTWSETDEAENQIPLTFMSVEENTKFAGIMSDVKVYLDEMLFKFILGQEPLEKFDAFREQLRSMDIETAISLQQAALDRYNSR